MRITKRVRMGLVLIAFVLLSVIGSTAQSADAAHPTYVGAFPVTGTLSTGTYYYEARVLSGEALPVLTITPPNGGASMSVSFSGPDCCSAEGYVSADSGTSERIRRSSEPFNIPIRQKLLLTVNVAAAKGQTVSFSLNLAIGMDGSGIVVTPPRPTPTPTPSPTPGSGVIVTPPNCADLAVNYYYVAGRTGLTRTIHSTVFNLSRTNRYLGGARSQWVEVLDITDKPMDARLVRLVGFVRFTQIAPLDVFRFSVVQTVRETRRT